MVWFMIFKFISLNVCTSKSNANARLATVPRLTPDWHLSLSTLTEVWVWRRGETHPGHLGRRDSLHMALSLWELISILWCRYYFMGKLPSECLSPLINVKCAMPPLSGSLGWSQRSVNGSVRAETSQYLILSDNKTVILPTPPSIFLFGKETLSYWIVKWWKVCCLCGVL